MSQDNQIKLIIIIIVIIIKAYAEFILIIDQKTDKAMK